MSASVRVIAQDDNNPPELVSVDQQAKPVCMKVIKGKAALQCATEYYTKKSMKDQLDADLEVLKAQLLGTADRPGILGLNGKTAEKVMAIIGEGASARTVEVTPVADSPVKTLTITKDMVGKTFVLSNGRKGSPRMTVR